jgi:hypothetical protein
MSCSSIGKVPKLDPSRISASRGEHILYKFPYPSKLIYLNVCIHILGLDWSN